MLDGTVAIIVANAVLLVLVGGIGGAIGGALTGQRSRQTEKILC